MTDEAKTDESDEKELEALDLARGELNNDDLNDLANAIDEIDFAARRTTPDCLARLRGLSARLVELIEQIEKGIRKPSPNKQLTPEEEKQYETLVNEGVALAEKGLLDRACEALERAVRLDPDEPVGLFNLGVVYGKLGENPKDPYYATSHGIDEIYAEKAAFCFDRVLELDPKNAQALTNLAAIHDIRGEPEAAVECLKKALEIDPNEAKAKEHLQELSETLGLKGTTGTK